MISFGVYLDDDTDIMVDADEELDWVEHRIKELESKPNKTEMEEHDLGMLYDEREELNEFLSC